MLSLWSSRAYYLLKMIHGSEKRHIDIQKVYEVQELERSFLSVSKMNDRGIEVQFLNNNAEVIYKNKKVHIRADCVGDYKMSYWINSTPINERDLKTTTKNNLVYGLTLGVNEKLSECEVYSRQNWLLPQFLNLVKGRTIDF